MRRLLLSTLPRRSPIRNFACKSGSTTTTTSSKKKVVEVAEITGPLLEDAVGFDKCLQRAASILVNLSERSMMKILHLHCGGRLTHYLGQSTVFDITGASEVAAEVDEAKSQRQYKDVLQLTREKKTELSTSPLRSASFQAVVCLNPLADRTTLLSVQEALRLVTCDGYVLFGASEEVWEELSILEELSADGGAGSAVKHTANVLSLQLIDCGGASKYLLGLIRKT